MKQTDFDLPIRSYDPDRDFPGLLRLRQRIEAYDQDGLDVTVKTLRKQLVVSGHDPAHDRWVIDYPGKPGSLVGHAGIFPRGEGYVDMLVMGVRPHWRHHGLGSRLLECAYVRLRELGIQKVSTGVGSANQIACAVFERHGFHNAGGYRLLEAPIRAPISEPDWPEGFYARRFAEANSLPLLVEALNGSYGDRWGHAESRVADTVETVEDYLTFWDPEDIFLVFDPAGRPAGICVVILAGTKANPDKIDVIDSPGIVPEYRHLDLVRPLLLTVMQWQRERHPGPVHLETWGDDEGMVAVYRDLGFKILKHALAYEKDLS